MKKKLIFPTFLIIFLFVVAAVYFALRLQMMPVSSQTEEKVRFEVPFGTSARKISSDLKASGIIKNDTFFYAAIKYPFILKFFFPSSNISVSDLKSGTYYVSKNMNYSELLEILMSGQQEYIHVSVPEGLTITKIASILEQNGICSKEAFISSCHKAEFIEYIGINADSCEGFLFPDTYFFNSGMDSDSVVKIMIDNFFEKVSSISSAASLKGQDLFDFVILSSIVEREYRVEEEAPLIASVFKNRLNRNIGLYSCATVEYILTEILGREHPKVILIEDTKINNPYNTYKWAGLPPGPISNPGMVALKACADTPKTNYYYFQIADPSEGRHVFTTTFDEHVSSHNLYTK